MSRGDRDVDPDCKLFVGGLEKDTDERELEESFAKFGTIQSVWISRDRPGFGFVVFDNPSDAGEAAKSLNGTDICGCRVRVEVSGRRSGGRDGGRDGGRGGRGGFRGGRGGFGGGRGGGGGGGCFQCGGQGHFARECPEGGGNGGRSRGGRGGGGGFQSRGGFRRGDRDRSRSPH